MKFLIFLLIPCFSFAQSSPSEGYIGSPLPYFGTLMGAKDPSGNIEPLTVDSSGNLNIAGSITASNPSVSATGAAVPADATMVGGTDGTNLRALSVNSSGVLALPQGASTSALQTTGNSSLSSIDGKTPALGQTTMSGSVPVAIASNQGAVPASQNGTWNINNISGTISLPTGAATAAKQPTLGIAGSASSDVLTVQGIASMTALKVDGSAVTQPVSLAAASAPIYPVGSYSEITNLTTSAQTFTAPAHAVGFVISTPITNGSTILYKIGATATTTSGMNLEPGRSENYNTGPAANISVIAATGSSQVVTVQWILNQ